MLIVQIKEFKLNYDAAKILSYATYPDVDKWLKQWTLPNNIKQVLCEDRQTGINKIAKQLKETIAYHKASGYDVPKCYDFRVSFIKIEEDGLFWPNGYEYGETFNLGDF